MKLLCKLFGHKEGKYCSRCFTCLDNSFDSWEQRVFMAASDAYFQIYRDKKIYSTLECHIAANADITNFSFSQ